MSGQVCLNNQAEPECRYLRNTDTLCVATIRQNILECPTVEAIPKDQYEARLKADMVAMLTDIQLEIQEYSGCSCSCSDGIVNDIDDVIQQKIDALGDIK